MEERQKLEDLWDTEGLGAMLRVLANCEEAVAWPTSPKTALSDARRLRMAAELRRLAQIAGD